MSFSASFKILFGIFDSECQFAFLRLVLGRSEIDQAQDAGSGSPGSRYFGCKTEHLTPELCTNKHADENYKELSLASLACSDPSRAPPVCEGINQIPGAVSEREP